MNQFKPIPIWRSLGLLRGLAILGVLVNHCAYLSMCYYQEWIVQAQDMAGTEVNLRLLVFIQELTRYAVPLFIFLAGHWLGHASHTGAAVWHRVRRILYPYLFWTCCGWVMSGLVVTPGRYWTVAGFLTRLGQGNGQMGYFFTILILQFYLVARWVAPWMRRRPILVILAGLGLQILCMAINYLDILADPHHQGSFQVPPWFLGRFSLYFVLGLWAGIHPTRLKSLLLSGWWTMFGLALVSAVLLLTESHLAYLLLQDANPLVLYQPCVMTPMADWKLTTAFWSTGFLLMLLALGIRWCPRSDLLDWLARNAFAIFMIHAPLLTITYVYLIKYGLPFPIHWLLVPVLLMGLSLAVPLLLANLARRLPGCLRIWLVGE